MEREGETETEPGVGRDERVGVRRGALHCACAGSGSNNVIVVGVLDLAFSS